MGPYRSRGAQPSTVHGRPPVSETPAPSEPTTADSKPPRKRHVCIEHCGGLKEMSPCSPEHLKTWFPVGAVLRALGGTALLGGGPSLGAVFESLRPCSTSRWLSRLPARLPCFSRQEGLVSVEPSAQINPPSSKLPWSWCFTMATEKQWKQTFWTSFP